MRFQSSAFQEAFKAHVVSLVENTNLCAIHAKRIAARPAIENPKLQLKTKGVGKTESGTGSDVSASWAAWFEYLSAKVPELDGNAT